MYTSLCSLTSSLPYIVISRLSWFTFISAPREPSLRTKFEFEFVSSSCSDSDTESIW
jgi:hypothetical protein